MKFDAKQIFVDRFAASKDQVAFRAIDNRAFTYHDLWSNARILAENWTKSGLKKNDVIAFMLPGGCAVACCYLACALGGFIACPIVGSLHPQTIEVILSTIKPALILRNNFAVHNNLNSDVAGSFVLDRDPDAPFLIMFTSGSTGHPKPILHSFGNVVASAFCFGRLTGYSPATRLYHVLPMTYMAGFLNTMLTPLLAGGAIIEGPLFSPESAVDFWTRPLQHGVNTLCIIPTIAAALCRLTRSQATIAAVRRQITQVQCTSAPIQLALRKKFKELFDLPLQDCYGMTELGGPLTFQTQRDAELCNEKSVPMQEIALSIRNGAELWIKSPFAMLGYLEGGALVNPADPDGYLNTGDLADYDEGKLRITGRMKDIIIRGGVNISPARVESVLSLCPGVDEVAVVGHAHSFWGEEIVAFVATSDDAASLQDHLTAYCKENLAPHERPDKIRFLSRLPRSFIGKVQKSALREI